MPPQTYTCFLICLLQGWAEGFVLKTNVELPYPKVNGVQLDSSSSPKVVKAFYEVNFVPAESPSEATWGLVALGDIEGKNKKGCSTSNNLCKYFTTSKNPTVVKIDELIENLVKKEDEVPIIKGFDPTAVKEIIDAFNKSVREQADNKIKLTSTSAPKEDGTVPVFKGTVDTEAVLNSKPVEETPKSPFYRTNGPHYQYQRPPPYYRPPTWQGWNKNPCLVGPCDYYSNRTPPAIDSKI